MKLIGKTPRWDLIVTASVGIATAVATYFGGQQSGYQPFTVEGEKLSTNTVESLVEDLKAERNRLQEETSTLRERNVKSSEEISHLTSVIREMQIALEDKTEELNEIRAQNEKLKNSPSVNAVRESLNAEPLKDNERPIAAVGNINIELLGIQREGAIIRLKLLMTSSKNTSIRLETRSNFGVTRLVLADGTQIHASEVATGGNSGRYADNQLVNGVPSEATITFSNVSPSVDTFLLFETFFDAEGRWGNRLEFRNIAL